MTITTWKERERWREREQRENENGFWLYTNGYKMAAILGKWGWENGGQIVANYHFKPWICERTH